MYTVPYGKETIQFSLPSCMRVAQAVSKPVRPIENKQAAVAEALAHPVGAPPLREIARPGNRVCIVFTDITRSCPDDLLVPPILAELKAAGVRDEDITLLCGIGMHRASTHEEKIAKLGAGIVAHYRVIDNEPQNPAALVDLGKTAGGVPVSVHRSVIESDLVIATGIVEPHQYGGYSGGRKTLAVGAAGEELIAYSHGPAFVDHPGTRLGRIEGNPFHEAITEAARRAGLRFILNVVLDDEKRLLRVTAGDPEAAFQDLVAFARSVYEVPIPQQYDIAIGGVGFPKDCQFVPGEPRALLPLLCSDVRASARRLFHHSCALRRGRRQRRRRTAFSVGDAGCAGRRFYSGRCAAQRISSRTAASLCDGESPGKDACDYRRQRVSRYRGCLQNDSGRYHGRSLADCHCNAGSLL